MTTLVLVHGGAHTGACWSRMTPHLEHPSVAIDLPGRAGRPGDLSTLRVDDWVDAIVEDIEALDPNERVVLVGHSLAGMSLPRVAGLIPERLARLVFISCTVPPEGHSSLGTLAPEVKDLADGLEAAREPTVVPEAAAIAMFCNDMDEEQTRFVLDGLVPEAPGPIQEASRLDGLRAGVPITWIRNLQDAVVPPERQDFFIETIRAIAPVEVVDFDAAHNAFMSRPADFAALLDEIAAQE